METGETLHLILMIFLTPISFGAMGLVVWWFITQKSDSVQAGNIELIWAQREAWGEERCRQIINRQLAEGMLPEMVRLAWGEPDSIEPLPNGGERWLYRPKAEFTGAVTFANGSVTDFSGAPHPADRGLTAWLIIAATLALALVVSAITLVVIFAVG